MFRRTFFYAALFTTLGCSQLTSFAQDIPHGQSKPPNEARSPEEALKHFEVPEGFSVEIVACEPDIVNPVAMTFDERGRIWITESLEYPRREPGKGRDRIKILEDTNQDGRADKVTIFAEGLNIPSGIAVGHGGVWVANAPDILFMQDTDGDDKADKIETVVTGFGRYDTHELPNSLTWGPDGCLYGLNGVFNPCSVKQNGKTFDFTCAMFRIDPRTREFSLFCEGTSNPWGIAWDYRGSAFISACVIDHLWHLTETGYYHRQGGAYPPHVWKLGSIVDHLHQQRAYCGITYFDSDAYPRKYRERLYMGNIHGNCLNVDRLERDGATYRGEGEPDFLSANDAWFMPVVQKVGPDGCLYVLDWYDRYHCYQDANRDPKGIDRLKGRLYRVRYNETPRAAPFDLAKETGEQLVKRLSHENIYFRETAQRVLAERGDKVPRELLEAAVLNETSNTRFRLPALWSLMSANAMEDDFILKLLDNKHTDLQAWAIRAAGNMHNENSEVSDKISELAESPSPDVRLQVAIAAPKLPLLATKWTLLRVLHNSADDKVIPHIVWENLHPLIESDSTEFISMITSSRERDDASLDINKSTAIRQLAPRIIDRLLAVPDVDPRMLARLINRISTNDATSGGPATDSVQAIASRMIDGQFSQEEVSQFQQGFAKRLEELRAKPHTYAKFHESLEKLSVLWNDKKGIEYCLSHYAWRPNRDNPSSFAAPLIAIGNEPVLELIAKKLDMEKEPVEQHRNLIELLGKSSHDQAAEILLERTAKLRPAVVPAAIEVLTSRVGWSKKLVEQIEAEKIDSGLLNANQIRKLLSFKDEQLNESVKKNWGTVRTKRDPAREKIIEQMRRLVRNRLSKSPGDPAKGEVVYTKLCGQCHKIHGKGQEVGPDITGNGRGSFDHLLSNVFDPSLVIGTSYQAYNVTTVDGLSVSGLLVEDSDSRVVIKVQGGEEKTIQRKDIGEIYRSELSLMPEGIEKQHSPEEIANLFAFLLLDKHYSEKSAKPIEGAQFMKRE